MKLSEKVYVVDYDIPVDQPGRRQFYRYLARILKGCTWKKSSSSVIMVDDRCVAFSILQLARACNAQYANVYEAVPLC
ncbi:MAG: hypothetical protein PVF58_01675 [Candidatus Methanofastidiosia archaeon]|jgi:hypothetical protein